MAAVEIQVMVGAKQRWDPMLLAGMGERQPLGPGHALLALDHQAKLHADKLPAGVCGLTTLAPARRSVVSRWLATAPGVYGVALKWPKTRISPTCRPRDEPNASGPGLEFTITYRHSEEIE
jgi:hypothetical protein